MTQAGAARTFAVATGSAGLTGFRASSGRSVLARFYRATLICAALCLIAAAGTWFGFRAGTGEEASPA